MTTDIFSVEPKRVFVTSENGLDNEFDKVLVNFYSYRETGGWASENRTVKLLPADANAFVDALSVTKDQLTLWVKAALGEEELASIEAKLSADIDVMLANNLPYFHDIEGDNPVPVNHLDVTTAWQTNPEPNQ